ncbi:zeta toxin family protein [Kitasatospora sp. NPDC127111]|uniref:zeta toxin family protein n=1 Tax=Kitasatospora sp. NPDC127111 TaxID=3345363 RepID=UPI0036328241
MSSLDERAYALSSSANALVFRRHIEAKRLVDGTCPEKPRVWFTGGQPGAGKSVMAGKLGIFAGRGLEISADAFRVDHPMWDDLLEEDDETAAFYTNWDARIWVKRAAELLIERRWNVILDSTLSDPNYAIEMIAKFKDAGYIAKVYFVAAPWAISLWSNVDRYRQLSGEDDDNPRPARTCLRETYREVCQGVLETAEAIDQRAAPVDKVRVVRRRDGAVCHRNDADSNGNWVDDPYGGTTLALTQEQQRRWTHAETMQFIADFSSLRAKMIKRGGEKWLAWFDDIEQLAIPVMAPGLTFPSRPASIASPNI